MITLKDAVISKPEFQKVANYELPEDVTKWNEEIMDQFFDQISYLPKEIGIDVIIKDVNENTGYAKGSVVAWYNNKQINFPVIVKDHKLFPFDIFVINKDGKSSYHNVTKANVKRELMSDDIAKVENMIGKNITSIKVKSPGGITPKQSVPLDEIQELLNPNITKMSSWKETAKKEDIEHLASVLKRSPGIAHSFVETTGDLVNNIVELNNNEKVVPDTHKKGKLDINRIVDAKQAITVLDSHLLDVTTLTPIKPPSVCELRAYQYPKMEDFMDRGASEISRFEASKNGKAITGIVLDCKRSNYYKEESLRTDSSDDKKIVIRNRRPQIFISADGKYYCERDDWEKTGISFYGSNINTLDGLLEKVVKKIKNNTTNDFLQYNKENKGDGSDKLFNKIRESNQGKTGDEFSSNEPTRLGGHYGGSKTLLCIYGAGNVYECIKFNANFKTYQVNGSKVYTSDSITVIPARVAGIQKVRSVQNDVLKMIVGNSKDIFLVPETSVFINTSVMERLDSDELMKPSRTIQKMYEEAAISKVSMFIGDDGYKLKGSPLSSLQKVAGFNDDTELNTGDVKNVLSVLGMKKEAVDEAMKLLLNRNMEKVGSKVDIYGLREDYINDKIYESLEKQARIKGIYKEIAKGLKKDLIKEASMIDDPEAVDTILSLNFINEENLMEYINQIQTIHNIISKLSGMLLMSRMGLSDLNESAIKKAIDGLEDVVEGLENVKLALGK